MELGKTIYTSKDFFNELLKEKIECKKKLNEMVLYLNSNTNIKLDRTFIHNFSLLINHWNFDKNNKELKDFYFYFKTTPYHEKIDKHIINCELKCLWNDYLNCSVSFKLKLLKIFNQNKMSKIDDMSMDDLITKSFSSIF